MQGCAQKFPGMQKIISLTILLLSQAGAQQGNCPVFLEEWDRELGSEVERQEVQEQIARPGRGGVGFAGPRRSQVSQGDGDQGAEHSGLELWSLEAGELICAQAGMK